MLVLPTDLLSEKSELLPLALDILAGKQRWLYYYQEKGVRLAEAYEVIEKRNEAYTYRGLIHYLWMLETIDEMKQLKRDIIHIEQVVKALIGTAEPPRLKTATIDIDRARSVRVLDLLQMYGADRLKKTGRQWSCCCPLHHEKTPSFVIDDEKNLWHCHGSCACGGDVIDLMKRLKHCSFIDAIKELERM